MLEKPNSLLLIIPPVFDRIDGRLVVDVDFAHNLRAYLKSFDTVSVLCPLTSTSLTFPSTVNIEDIPGHANLDIQILPEPYREDKYFIHRRRVGDQLESAIRSHEFILLSPHAAFDWPTLAAKICIEANIPYDMEADWSVPAARRQLWQRMPWGLRKARKWVTNVLHDASYFKALRGSSLSLLQGGDVYNDLSGYAQHPYSVLNVQVGVDDHITEDQLGQKLERIAGGEPLHIVYAGRANEIKGPFYWIETISLLRDRGCRFRATWIGDGEDLEGMKRFAAERGLSQICSFPGKLPRDEARALVLSADIFMFCHLIKESPRCLVEALALATPIIGFDGNFARGLVSDQGGGRFVPIGDVSGLAAQIAALSEDRNTLRTLIQQAAQTGHGLEREAAITHRIELIKLHLGGRHSAAPNA